MLTVESLLILVICAGVGAVIGLAFEQVRACLYHRKVDSEKERPAPASQTSLSLVVSPPPPRRHYSSVFPRQSDCIDAIISSPIPDDSYMITTECIIFTGTREECADFLEDRGIIPFEDTIEPFDARLQTKMNELGVRVFRRNLFEGLEGR